jgi:hypothetical protein
MDNSGAQRPLTNTCAIQQRRHLAFSMLADPFATASLRLERVTLAVEIFNALLPSSRQICLHLDHHDDEPGWSSDVYSAGDEQKRGVSRNRD